MDSDSMEWQHPAVPETPQPASPALLGHHICPQCGADNPPQAHYCRRDGFPLAPQAVTKPQTRSCSKCGGDNLPSARFCRWCGFPFQPADKSESVRPGLPELPELPEWPALEPPPASKRCPQCGTENPRNARFCRKDGFAFPLESASVRRPPRNPPPRLVLHCPVCGTRYEAGVGFCRKDGAALEELVGPKISAWCGAQLQRLRQVAGGEWRERFSAWCGVQLQRIRRLLGRLAAAFGAGIRNLPRVAAWCGAQLQRLRRWLGRLAAALGARIRKIDRKRALWIAGGALLVLVLAGTLYGGWQWYRNTDGQWVARMRDLATEQAGVARDAEIRRIEEQLRDRSAKRKDPVGAARAAAFKTQGQNELASGNLEQAIAALTAAHEADPTDVDTLSQLGHAYFLRNDFQNTEKYILAALAVEPGNAALWANLGRVYSRKNAVESAVASYANAYRFSRDRQQTHEWMKSVVDSETDITLKRALNDFYILAQQVFIAR